MAIDAKELMLGVRFKAWGLFIGAGEYTKDGSETTYIYRFEYLGGSFSIEVDQSEYLTPPPEGTAFVLDGEAKYNSYNGTVRLVPENKKQVSELKPEDYARGVHVVGAGVVEQKKQSVMNKKTFLKTSLKFKGGLHMFSGLTPELFSKIPNSGSFCRFIWGLQPMTENHDGRQSQFFVPVLMNVVGEDAAPTTPAAPAFEPVQKPSMRRAE